MEVLREEPETSGGLGLALGGLGLPDELGPTEIIANNLYQDDQPIKLGLSFALHL